MALYFVVQRDSSSSSGIVESYNVGEPSEKHEVVEQTDTFKNQKHSLTPDLILVRASIIDPPVTDPVTQTKDDPVDTWDGVYAMRTFVVRDKTPEELGEQNVEVATIGLQNSSVDLSLVLVDLIDWTIATTSLELDDFPPLTRDAYLTIKEQTVVLQDYDAANRQTDEALQRPTQEFPRPALR